MIKHTKAGWVLYSKDGKRKLGGPYPSRTGAVQRERQVKALKHMKSGKK